MSRHSDRARPGSDWAGLYDEITGRIVAELEAGRVPWVQPWGTAAAKAPLGLPRNAATGRAYSGINVLILWGAVIEHGFPGQGWLTFRQALALGGHVRKGERGTTVVYADRFVPDDEKRRARTTGDPSGGGADRAAILNHAFYKLLKTARQFYLLGPNIRAVPTDFQERFEARLIVSDFVTVASDVRRVDQTGGAREALVRLTKELDGSTLVYCQSPGSVRRVAQLMVEGEVSAPAPDLRDVVDWIGRHFHPEWIVARALSRGIGVHHGRLPRALAQLQVRLFNSGALKFLVCTSTLIEGVNTAAKHVVIYDNKISKKPFDYFTYRNIQGRSGRMFRHFVGTVHLFHSPPQPDLLDVDFPAFSQTDAASDGLLVQLDEDDLGGDGLRRVNKLKGQPDLSMETIRANAHVDPQQQIDLARHIRLHARELHPALSWRGEPSNDQIYKVCELLFDTLLAGVGRDVVRTGRHLAFLLTQLRQLGAAGFIRSQANPTDSKALADPSDRVENALEFLRNWASFQFPRALTALERIQAEVFGRLGLPIGSYAPFAVRVENLMLPPALAALDEYGLPLQLVVRLQALLPATSDLDAVLVALRQLNTARLRLDPFEKLLLDEVKETI